MRKSSIGILLIALVLAVAAAVVQASEATPDTIEGFAAATAAGSGEAWVAVYGENKINFYLLAENGIAKTAFSTSRKSGDSIAHIPYMTTDEEGRLYFLKRYTGATDGKALQRQELVVYTPKLLPLGRINTIRLDNSDDTDDALYSHIYAATASVVVTGVNSNGDGITRKAYDIEALTAIGGMTIKAQRVYPAFFAEGVYKIVTAGTDVVYLSQTGKVFFAQEDARVPVQIYPDSRMQTVSYTSFITQSTASSVIIGEQSGGNILRLYPSDGQLEYIMEGNRAFGTLRYTARDVLDISFAGESETEFVAVVQNSNTGSTELIIARDNAQILVEHISLDLWGRAWSFIGSVLLNLVLILLGIALLTFLYTRFQESRTILVRLVLVSVPLLLLTLVLFGVYSFTSYQSSLNSTYRTKVEDQGNLLRALFSSNSFDKITAPEMYNSTEYAYLRTQMGTRDVYTKSAYYVGGQLYTGIDWNLPCLYPFGINHYGKEARDLYLMAALTGNQQSGVVRDSYGERIACITPVGSSSGNTVFLLETSIFQAEIDKQTSGFIRNYLIIATICLVATCVLLLLSFLRILRPLGGIIEGLDEFSKGNRNIRLTSTTNDELADISRVFNKMAKDIDIQIYNLRTMGETYYRFVPQQVFGLLGKDNLADIELGSAVEGKYSVLVCNLNFRQIRMDFESMKELTNHFFAIVNRVAGENKATLLTGSVSLRDLYVICPSGDTAVRVAIQAIASVDEYNAKNAINQRLEASFFLHRVHVGFGICGDENRFVPAMMSSELDGVLQECDSFRRLSSRLIVTDVAYAELETAQYFHRFIGDAGDENENTRLGLYDFYDSSAPSLIRLLNDTKGTFDKAMALYRQKRYYDAKILFAMVLRENQYDNVARYYIFQCEKNL